MSAISSVKLWRYVLPSVRGEGWAIIVIGSDGFFAAVSDYDNYAYWWGAMGCADAREFFLDNDYARYPDYLLSKLSQREWWDGAATVKKARELIEAVTRVARVPDDHAGPGWTRRRANEEYALLREHDNLDSRESFALWVNRTGLAYEDACGCATVAYPPMAMGFAKHIMPRLVAAIRAELAAERPPTPINLDPGDENKTHQRME